MKQADDISKIALARLFLFVAMALSPLSHAAQNLPDLIERVRPSVVYVASYDASGKRISSGTGFAVSPTDILTNYHVIAGASRVEVRTVDRTVFTVSSISPANKDADLARLQLPDGSRLKPLRFSTTPPRVGTKIFVVGNPLGLTGTVSDGIVSALRSLPKLGNLIQITAPISAGSSGSPVVNLDGEVVGLVTMDIEGGQNLNFAIASESLLTFWPQSEVAENNKSLPRSGKSGRWRLLDTHTSYDTETLTKTQTVVSVWIKYDNTDGSYTKVFTEVNCPTNLLRESRSLSYSSSGDYARENTIDTKWKSPVPESNGEQMYQIFCKEKPDYQSSVDYSRYSELYRQGLDFQGKQKYDEAIATYSQMISELPDYAGWAFNVIAGMKLSQGKVREAKNAVLEAIKLEPKQADYYSTLGDVYKEEKDIPQAIANYWKSLRLVDEFAVFLGRESFPDAAVRGLAEIYETRKDFVELTKLYVFATSNGGIYFEELADTYDKRKMPVQAKASRLKGIKHYEDEIKNQTGKPFILNYWNLTELLDAAGEDIKLQTTVVGAIELFPNDWIMVDRLAKNYNKHKNWSKAIQLLNESLPRMKKDSEKRLLLYTLKASFLGLGQKDEATRIEAQISQIPYQ